MFPHIKADASERANALFSDIAALMDIAVHMQNGIDKVQEANLKGMLSAELKRKVIKSIYDAQEATINGARELMEKWLTDFRV